MSTSENHKNRKNKRKYRFIVAALTGLIIGLIFFILYISKAHSYLSDDPRACINCHIMAPEYSTWAHSSHGRNTVCNDCHVPHDNVARKYYFKAMDGLRHATIFSWRAEPQVITMHKPGQKVVQENCIRCHDALNSVVGTAVTAKQARHGDGKLCWDCHSDVPHGNNRGLNSAPNARVPLEETPVPLWLDKMMKETRNVQKD